MSLYQSLYQILYQSSHRTTSKGYIKHLRPHMKPHHAMSIGPNNTLEQYIIDDTVLPLVPYCLINIQYETLRNYNFEHFFSCDNPRTTMLLGIEVQVSNAAQR